VAQALRERASQRYFMTEHYGPDGETMEAWESHPIEPGQEGVRAVIVTGTDYAKPRTDWRERGIVPPEGHHRSVWGD